jgi:hypothetical protein
MLNESVLVYFGLFKLFADQSPYGGHITPSSNVAIHSSVPHKTIKLQFVSIASDTNTKLLATTSCTHHAN